MSSIAVLRPIPFPSTDTLRRDPVAQAFLLLRIAFTIAPILFGLDKFAGVLTDDWTRYLAAGIQRHPAGLRPGRDVLRRGRRDVAGLVVLVAPRFGGLLVAGWLAGIIVSLLLSAATVTSRRATSACCSAR